MTPSGRTSGLLALLTALVQAAGTALLTRGHPADVGVTGYVLLVLSGLALADRHRFPRRNAAIVGGTILMYLLLGGPPGLAFVAPVIAGSALLTAGYRWWAWAGAAGGYNIWILIRLPSMNQALTVAALVAGAGVLTELGALAGRPVRRALREQRRLTEERRRRQASEERLRIAAELHDVLGHHLSLINVRAGVGLHLMARDPDQARLALDTIQQTSAEALREVQSVLNTLYPNGEAPPRAPAPGLDRLAALTANAGLPVRVETIGASRTLPAGVDRAAYRIVQEALTNVRRHAGPGASATVTIVYRKDALTIQVDDSGEPTDAPPGNGITGMRERAAALGGSLSAAVAPAGGWRVRAELPLAP
jgi:signal transduction histidine kinase